MLPLDSVVDADVIGFRMRTGAAVVDAVLARHGEEVRKVVFVLIHRIAVGGNLDVFLNRHDLVT